MGIEFITDPKIEQYIKNLYVPFDSVLVEMHRLAKERNFPIVGPLVGRVLYLLTKLVRPPRILELGSGFGYSAYWFTKAMGQDAKITLTEYSQDNIDLARGFLAKAGIQESSCEFLVGDSLKLIEQLDGEFDIIFNDIDKASYPTAFQKAIPRLRKEGMLISDNVLWGGSVIEETDDPDTLAMKEYTSLIFESKELCSLIVPIRDGVSISLKLS